MARPKDLIALAAQKAIVVKDIALKPSAIHPTDTATNAWRVVLTFCEAGQTEETMVKRGPFFSKEAAENILNDLRARFGLLKEA